MNHSAGFFNSAELELKTNWAYVGIYENKIKGVS